MTTLADRARAFTIDIRTKQQAGLSDLEAWRRFIDGEVDLRLRQKANRHLTPAQVREQAEFEFSRDRPDVRRIAQQARDEARRGYEALRAEMDARLATSGRIQAPPTFLGRKEQHPFADGILVSILTEMRKGNERSVVAELFEQARHRSKPDLLNELRGVAAQYAEAKQGLVRLGTDADDDYGRRSHELLQRAHVLQAELLTPRTAPAGADTAVVLRFQDAEREIPAQVDLALAPAFPDLQAERVELEVVRAELGTAFESTALALTAVVHSGNPIAPAVVAV